MNTKLSPLSVFGTGVLCVCALGACSPVAQLLTAKTSTNRASVRFSSPSGDVSDLDLNSFNPDKIQGEGQPIPAYLGQTAQGQIALPNYTTSLMLSLGSGTNASRSISLQVGDKLVTGYTCALSNPTTGLTTPIGTLNICNLSYNSGKRNLTASSGTFSVTSLDGQKLRFTARALLTTAGGGTVTLDVEGQVDDFSP